MKDNTIGPPVETAAETDDLDEQPDDLSRPADGGGIGRRKRRASDVGIFSESCSREMLGLYRFSQSPKLFEMKSKESVERLLNPFGDPWATRKARNRFVPVATSSSWGVNEQRKPDMPSLLDGDPSIPLLDAERYINYSSNASSDYHYDETVIRLAPNMPKFEAMRRSFGRAGLKKKFIGYVVVNYDDHFLLGHARRTLPEEYYLHFPEESMDPAHRINFKDGGALVASGHVFDVRNPEVRTMLAKAVVDAMVANDVDAVLIDYAVRAYAFGLPGLIDLLPDEWAEKFQEHQLELLREIFQRARSANKEIFLNGVMQDGIGVTHTALVRAYAKYSNGLFWEQPFRWEWRGYEDGETDYYKRLDEFFDACYAIKKKIFIKIGTYRFHATEDVDPSWYSRFAYTDQGIERHLAMYQFCFYLLYYNRYWSPLIYTHPSELFDIYCSEAYFSFWDINIGEAVGKRCEVSPHVHMRAFENGLIFVNNTLKPIKIRPAMRPSGYDGAFPKMVLAPLSGAFWEFPAASVVRNIHEIGRTIRPRERLLRLLRLLGKRRDAD